MRIFILGATGFIGNAIFNSLVSEHDVIIGSRRPIDEYEKWKHIDFLKENNWDEILSGIDLVINAIGIIEGDFEQVQTKSPIKLFYSCIKKEINVINISAIGAEKENPATSFLASKKMTDDFLLTYKQSKIIYPGIVLGKGAQSTKFFAELAQLPIIPVIGNQTPPVIHISQLILLIKQVVERFDTFPQQIFAVSKPEQFTKIMTSIRGKSATYIKVPEFIFSLLFSIFPKVKIGIFNKNMLAMLSSISAFDYKPICDEASTKINSNNLVRSHYFIQYISILSISFIWIWSGVSSLISWDVSQELMKEIGANQDYATLFIYAGSIADIFLGFAIFLKGKRKQILIVQILFIIIYTLILSVLAPSYWLHPFGILSKNIPLITLSLFLFQNNEN